MKRDIITGLDIGSSKVCAAIAEVKDKGEITIRGVGTCSCSAMSGGVVSDLDRLTDAVVASLGEAEEKAKLKAHAIITNAGGPFVKGTSYEGALSVSHMPRAVKRRDVNRLISVTRDVGISLGEDPLHLIPLGYTLDNQDGIENPLGLYGSKLKMRLYIVSCATNLIRNISNAINHAGYEMKDIIYTGMANSYALSEEERFDGAALADIGSRVTELLVFSKGKLVFNVGINMGGADLTDEISSHFKVPKRLAEDLKIRYGTVHEGDLSAEERLTVDTDRGEVHIDRTGMNLVLHSKMKEILASLRKKLEKSGHIDRLPGGVIMSGAPLLMSGVVEMAEKEFNLPVRMGAAAGMRGEAGFSSNPAYTTSIGLLKYGIHKFKKGRHDIFKKESLLEKSISRLKEILTDYF